MILQNSDPKLLVILVGVGFLVIAGLMYIAFYRNPPQKVD